MDTSKQPKPFEPDWQRYCPQKPFPPYRHIPGVTPHPIRDPRGHSYGIEEVHDVDPLPPELWQQNEDYLYGVDLYNFAYWWEAHEAWGGVVAPSGRHLPPLPSRVDSDLGSLH